MNFQGLLLHSIGSFVIFLRESNYLILPPVQSALDLLSYNSLQRLLRSLLAPPSSRSQRRIGTVSNKNAEAPRFERFVFNLYFRLLWVFRLCFAKSLNSLTSYVAIERFRIKWKLNASILLLHTRLTLFTSFPCRLSKLLCNFVHSLRLRYGHNDG